MKSTTTKALFLFAVATLLLFPQVNYSSTLSTNIELSAFYAVFGDSQVTLFWKTETELNNAGFNIYRSETENEGYAQINDSLIPAEGISQQGASYGFVDTEVQNGKTYYYKLEDLDLGGTPTMHGPIIADVPVSTSTSTTISATTSIITTSTTSSITTSTTTFSTTTTTSIRSGPCAAEAIYGENAEEAELLRKYRDNVLSKTPEGQEIIETYYKFSPKVTMLLEQRPLLKNRAKTFIDGMLPGIRKKIEKSSKKP
jgi:hypothetical protein